jgi:hypothetical protein
MPSRYQTYRGAHPLAGYRGRGACRGALLRLCPRPTLCDAPQGINLLLHGLLVRARPDVDRGPVPLICHGCVFPQIIDLLEEMYQNARPGATE